MVRSGRARRLIDLRPHRFGLSMGLCQIESTGDRRDSVRGKYELRRRCLQHNDPLWPLKNESSPWWHFGGTLVHAKPPIHSAVIILSVKRGWRSSKQEIVSFRERDIKSARWADC